MRTLKALKELKTVKVIKAVIGGLCIEDIPIQRAKWEKLAEDNNAKLIETDSTFSLEGFNGLEWKPKVKRITHGTVKFKSVGYQFTSDSGNTSSSFDALKKDNVTNDGFRIETYTEGQYIEYKVVV